MAKVTKKQYFERLAEIVKHGNFEDGEELNGFITHEIELLNNKASKSTETKTQKENKEIVETIYSALVKIGKAVTITELQTACPSLSGFSNQKMSALLKKLTDSKRVEKILEKKKTLFKAVV